MFDAPGFSVEWYRATTAFAAETPAWLRAAAEAGTDLLLAGFAALFLAAWWRARSGGAKAMALALLAPPATVTAYLVSEGVKALIRQDRPCRAVADAVAVAACPPVGDWSFPSNHAAIAGGAAVAVWLAWRGLAALAVPLAALEGYSRVFLGVHYPHDVLVGLAVGALVAAAVMAAAAPVARLVVHLRGHALLGPLLTRSTARTAATGMHHASAPRFDRNTRR
ncbi:phosphatase PAP2 family protein [Nocardiopsis trehalosi]|jgi:undecaprenyl-diphosphatase|uniref:phosphatase PAP2 family protein n=1 Tax=Nocardiopsis trehalosi TaxID=109329 RepID=UPI000834AC45|nr:phosphatase PAP2 family protein [Nocardiopsis trehalosi]